MPIEDQRGWDEAYDLIGQKYSSMVIYIYKRLFKKLNFFETTNKENVILDVGCGDGSVLYFLEKRAYKKLFGFDIREYKSPSPAIELRQGDMFHCPYPDNFANVLICMNVMHHCINHEQYKIFISECKRVLKKKGHIFFVEPEDNFFRKMTHFICSIPILNKVDCLNAKKKIFDEEKKEHELFFGLNLDNFLRDENLTILSRKSCMESLLIHAQA
jgi:SAM-dependent methyltransferase